MVPFEIACSSCGVGADRDGDVTAWYSLDEASCTEKECSLRTEGACDASLGSVVVYALVASAIGLLCETAENATV